MSRIYEWRGGHWQFDDEDVPAGAVPLEAPMPRLDPEPEKAAEVNGKSQTPANKGRRVSNKGSA